MLRRSRLVAVVTVVLATLAGVAATTVGSSAATALPNPTRTTSGTANVAFYYRGSLALDTATPQQIISRLGHASVVVGVRSKDEAATTKAIRSAGATPYRYVQFYWAPTDREYEGIDLQQHPSWAFCRDSTATPTIGRHAGGEDWAFLDLNKVAVRSAVRSRLQAIKDAGWAGIMLDRGRAATQNGTDISGHSIWFARSTCPGRVHTPGATFADAYVGLLPIAQSVGLQVMFNNGGSPFARDVKMRPDPRDRDCRVGNWSACQTLNDVWPRANLVLNELAAAPRDTYWLRDFLGNRASERDSRYGHRTVALVTTLTVGGASQQTRTHIYYAWSRIKMFDLPVAVNTGDAACPATSASCNHYGTYPELVNIRFGRPLGSGPTSSRCTSGSTVRCVWSRRYAAGLDLVNVSPVRKGVRALALGTSGCRYVFDQMTGKPLASNRCVRAVSLSLGPWTGHPLRYARHPW